MYYPRPTTNVSFFSTVSYFDLGNVLTAGSAEKSMPVRHVVTAESADSFVDEEMDNLEGEQYPSPTTVCNSSNRHKTSSLSFQQMMGPLRQRMIFSSSYPKTKPWKVPCWSRSSPFPSQADLSRRRMKTRTNHLPS